MAAPNVEQILVDRFWAILEAPTMGVAALVKPGNRIKVNGDNKFPFKMTWNEADFPELTVGYPSLTHSMFTLERSYAMGGAAFSPATDPTVVDLDYVMTIEIVHPFQRLEPATQLVNEVLKAIYLAGPQLARVNGVVTPLVFKVQPGSPATVNHTLATGRPFELATTDGRVRLVSMIRQPLKLRVKGSQLVA